MQIRPKWLEPAVRSVIKDAGEEAPKKMENLARRTMKAANWGCDEALGEHENSTHVIFAHLWPLCHAGTLTLPGRKLGLDVLFIKALPLRRRCGEVARSPDIPLIRKPHRFGDFL